ncbi:MAG: hypothetical protein WBIAU1_01310 [Wolbachia endosymbiont of Drosophila biauraria]|nr:MAG: hypothetical protein WBIAU1_01310 [Wolbachia endosymbiont of Drosophila biauraria]
MLKFIDRDLWSKLSPDIAKNLLDKLRQPPYHETEAIYLSSLYRLNDKKTQRIWCLMFNFLHYVHSMSLSNF